MPLATTQLHTPIGRAAAAAYKTVGACLHGFVLRGKMMTSAW